MTNMDEENVTTLIVGTTLGRLSKIPDSPVRLAIRAISSIEDDVPCEWLRNSYNASLIPCRCGFTVDPHVKPTPWVLEEPVSGSFLLTDFPLFRYKSERVRNAEDGILDTF
jgi:hypothetical protein